MSWINDEWDSYKHIIQCDRCGKIMDYEKDPGLFDEMDRIKEYWSEIFKSDHYINRRPRPFPEVIKKNDFCPSCMKEITPIVYKLRDIDELYYFVRKLRRIINECKRKNKNNG